MRAKHLHCAVVSIPVIASCVTIFYGSLSLDYPIALLMPAAGVLLMAWAVVHMRLDHGRFRVTPALHAKARLTTTGPYRLIRHPMYLSLLLMTLYFVLFGFNYVRLTAWLVLFADISLKMRIEERLLKEKLDGYAAYMARTKRLIPWIY